MIREIGNRLILVGVAHILPKSMVEVRNTIQSQGPEVVGVELCYDRYVQLTSESEDKEDFSGFSSTVLFAKFLRYFQRKIGEQTGMIPGEEMLTAVDVAGDNDIEISLIDRDINFTLQRLLDKMSFWEKMKIIFGVIFSFFLAKDEIDIENLTSEEVVDELITTFRDFSETAYEVLIAERDQYMADRITELLKTRNGKILCVVGAGHIPGLTKIMESRFEDGIFDSWHNISFEW